MRVYMIHQHHRQTDRWTTCHRAVKKLLILFCFSCMTVVLACWR